MDTKWRNRLLLILWLLLLTVGISGLQNLITVGSMYLKKDYFQTSEFSYELDRFISYLSFFELSYTSKEEAKKLITVTDEDIREYRDLYGDLFQQVSGIRNEYDPQIEEALASQHQEMADIYKADRDRKIEEITNLFKNDEYVTELIVKEKEQSIDQYYQEQEQHRSEFVKYKKVFAYHLTDVTTGEVFTNVTSRDGSGGVMNQKDMMFMKDYASLSTGDRPIYYYVNFGETFLFPGKSGVFEGQIGIPKSAPASSFIIASKHAFQLKRIAFLIYTVVSILTLIGSVRIYKKYPIAEMSEVQKFQPFYSQIPMDIRLLAVAFSGIMTLVLIFSADEAFYHRDVSGIFFQSLNHAVFSTLFVFLLLFQIRLLWEQSRSGSGLKGVWSRAIVYRGYLTLREFFSVKSVAIQALIVLSIVFAFGLGLSGVVLEPEAAVVYFPALLIIGIPILWFITRRVGYFNLIVRSSGELASGNFEQDLPVKGKSAFAALARNINTLKYGFKTSQNEQAKSERLKTELITNVSHDLRTPLTSIITYTELLKNKELSVEDRNAYIEIIDRKSQRLKVLIDDLFEASKMASGNIELVKERIDLVQLLQQALAEYDETIKESSLQLRIATPDEPVFALVDGQKLWRVFDNLIGNCVKYSMDDTRIYISVKALADQAVITFKNVTKYELSENIDELFERFKRGDASRHTEGSGLGLAIAKSIIDMHDGKLEMEIDGDLFKVTVTIKLENE